MTPMKANCEPPVNMSRLSAMACHTVSCRHGERAEGDAVEPGGGGMDRPTRMAGAQVAGRRVGGEELIDFKFDSWWRFLDKRLRPKTQKFGRTDGA
jgi:hypothetical protein